MRNHDEKRPTLKTIAEITGLSLSTVSLSLRDGSNLKQTTRDKVAQAAEQIGYVPNRAGVRLRTGKTNVITLILSADENSLDFTRRLIQGIGSEIQTTRFHLNVIPEFVHSDPVAAVKYIINNQSSDGVILTHTSARDPRVQLLIDHELPFVTHGRTEFYTPHPFHDFHIERYIEVALDRLAARGRKRCLLVPADNKTTNYITAVSAFKRALANTDLIGEVVENPGDGYSIEAARRYGTKLVNRTDPFDAIICSNELVGLAIINGLSDGGKVLGCDFDMVCRQTTDILPMLYPTLDTVSEDLYATGQELAKLLINAMNGDAVETLQSLHEPIVHWRSKSS